jgi:hypothetical protein
MRFSSQQDRSIRIAKVATRLRNVSVMCMLMHADGFYQQKKMCDGRLGGQA